MSRVTLTSCDTQARPNWLLPQLLPDIRRGDPQRRCPPGGQVRIQSEEDWRAPSGQQGGHEEWHAAGRAAGEHGARDARLQQEDLARELASEGVHHRGE